MDFALGDRTSSQPLADLSSILGTTHQLDHTSTWFLKTDFLQRLPANVHTILSAFHSKPLIDLTKKADSIMLQERPSTSIPSSLMMSLPSW